jgi:1D-myo-inositol 3-kinase
MAIPNYLVIGHITKDLLAEGFTIGGTAMYAAVTAQRLGKQAAIVTSAAADLVLPPTFDGIQVVRALSPVTTTFRNIYSDGARQQYVMAVANPIQPQAIPAAWRQAPLVHLGPLVGEVDEALVHQFAGARVIATPQGWFRSWDKAGLVSLGEWPGAERLLPHLTALILSDEDVRGDPACVERFAALTRTLVLTHGPRGASVYRAGEVRDFPTRRAKEVDPTGAGDVFAAAFIIRLAEVDDPWEAARFANIVASFSVEGQGVSAIPSREQVEAFRASRSSGLS